MSSQPWNDPWEDLRIAWRKTKSEYKRNLLKSIDEPIMLWILVYCLMLASRSYS